MTAETTPRRSTPPAPVPVFEPATSSKFLPDRQVAHRGHRQGYAGKVPCILGDNVAQVDPHQDPAGSTAPDSASSTSIGQPVTFSISASARDAGIAVVPPRALPSPLMQSGATFFPSATNEERIGPGQAS